jgi:dienelactone hydrolase
MTEHAVVFAAAHPLVGVLADAGAQGSPHRPAVVFLNAGMLHRVGPNRLYVRIARELARCGFVSLRFDRSGVGDSPPRIDGLPLRAAALNDVRDALDFVAAKEAASTFVLVGLCSGADLAFRAAVADERVVGAVFIDGLPYNTVRSRLYRYVSWIMRRGNWRRLLALDGPLVRRLLRSRQQARPADAVRQRDVPLRHEAESQLRELVSRGMRLLLLYTADRLYSYPRHFVDTFPNVRSDRVDVTYFPDADHTFTLRANQDLLIRRIVEWISCFK